MLAPFITIWLQSLWRMEALIKQEMHPRQDINPQLIAH